MKKLFIYALAAAGLALIPTAPAKASAPVTVAQSGPTALPAVVHGDYVVIREGGRRYYRRRRVYYYHGQRRVSFVRVYL